MDKEELTAVVEMFWWDGALKARVIEFTRDPETGHRTIRDILEWQQIGTYHGLVKLTKWVVAFVTERDSFEVAETIVVADLENATRVEVNLDPAAPELAVDLVRQNLRLVRNKLLKEGQKDAA